MTFFTIPVGNDLPFKKFRIQLSNVTYTLTFRFNVRSNRWVMDIGDSTNNPILVGLPLLINRDLTGQFVTLAIPPGSLIVSDDTNQQNQATLYSFGIDHTLWYVV